MMEEAKVARVFWWPSQNFPNANLQEESESVFCLVGCVKLGFKCPEEMLYITCLRSANGIITWFSLKYPICYFANYA
jgi:hypothetical protein